MNSNVDTPRLTAEARQLLDQYLAEREQRVFNRTATISVSAILTLLALLATAFLSIKSDAEARAELTAQRQIQPKIELVNKAIAEQQRKFIELQSQLSSSYGTIRKAAIEIQEIKLQSQRALEGLNRGEGSLIFAEQILKIRSELLRLRQAEKAWIDTKTKFENGIANVSKPEPNSNQKGTNSDRPFKDLLRDTQPK